MMRPLVLSLAAVCFGAAQSWASGLGGAVTPVAVLVNDGGSVVAEELSVPQGLLRLADEFPRSVGLRLTLVEITPDGRTPLGQQTLLLDDAAPLAVEGRHGRAVVEVPWSELPAIGIDSQVEACSQLLLKVHGRWKPLGRPRCAVLDPTPDGGEPPLDLTSLPVEILSDIGSSTLVAATVVVPAELLEPGIVETVTLRISLVELTGAGMSVPLLERDYALADLVVLDPDVGGGLVVIQIDFDPPTDEIQANSVVEVCTTLRTPDETGPEVCEILEPLL
jgi:hypothetical protein